MAKRSNDIVVTTFFDGKQDATEVFVGLIVEQTENKRKEKLAKTQEVDYNESAFQDNLVLS